MIAVTCARPWLMARFETPQRMLSWAPHRAGFVTGDTVAWREVRDADLSVDFDAVGWLNAELRQAGQDKAVGMMTSRNVEKHTLHMAKAGEISAGCLATVGLSNAERVGHRQELAQAGYGTINLLVALSHGLTEAAMIEAISIATQARTAAIIEADLGLPTGHATGTGTDCIVIACPAGDIAYAGLHTETGEAIGRAVYDAVAMGAQDWLKTEGRQ